MNIDHSIFFVADDSDESDEIESYESERKAFEAYLKTRGLRLTKQREIIFDEIFRLDEHLDADRIAVILKSKGKDVSRATVYRTLDLMGEAGLVKGVRLSDSHMMYEPLRTGDVHDHMVCQKCGKIIEFYSEQIERQRKRICRQYEFTPIRHSVVIYGICSTCKQKDSETD